LNITKVIFIDVDQFLYRAWADASVMLVS